MRSDRKALSLTFSIVGFLLLFFCLLLTATHVVGTDHQLYLRLQRENGVTEAIGIAGDDLARLDEALAQYLKGDHEALEIEAEVYGSQQQAFNEREKAHMEDVFALFALLRRALLILLPLSLAFLAAGAWLGGQNALRRWGKRAALALCLLILAVCVFADWAAADFDRAFTAFHHVLFTNSLWLLDPATDLMIRMLPSGFFMDIGIGIILLWAALSVTVCVLIGIAGKCAFRALEKRAPREEKLPS